MSLSPDLLELQCVIEGYAREFGLDFFETRFEMLDYRTLNQVAAYDDFRRRRLFVRPGITGLAQVYGNSLMPWDERILYDIAYVRRCGFFLDLSILLRTILVVFVGERRMTRPFTDSAFAVFITPPDENRVDKSQI